MLRTFTPVALLAAALLSVGVAHAQSDGKGSACAPAYHATCYLPADVSQAEHAFGRAVSPSALVKQVTHLRLAGVDVSRDTAHGPVIAIYYMFGVRLPLDRPIPLRGPAYVTVTEYAGMLYPRSGVQVHAQGTATYVTGAFAHHNASFAVAGRGITKQHLVQIARALAGR